jgi:alanyl-tRNA synthetase
VLGGGGGGKPEQAQGQGLDPSKVAAATEALWSRLDASLSGAETRAPGN